MKTVVYSKLEPFHRHPAWTFSPRIQPAHPARASRRSFSIFELGMRMVNRELIKLCSHLRNSAGENCAAVAGTAPAGSRAAAGVGRSVTMCPSMHVFMCVCGRAYVRHTLQCMMRLTDLEET
jgi:hypothetical protein